MSDAIVQGMARVEVSNQSMRVADQNGDFLRQKKLTFTTMKIDYQRGWNAAVKDSNTGSFNDPSHLQSEDYQDGYRDGQDHVLFQRALEREEVTPAPTVTYDTHQITETA